MPVFPSLHEVSWYAGYSLVDEHGGRIRPGALQVGHGIPLIDAALLGGDAALVERHPRESNAPWEVVEPTRHLACLMEDLQGGPAGTWCKLLTAKDPH